MTLSAYATLACATVAYFTYKALTALVPSAKNLGKLGIKNKVVVITGASSGLGRALAIEFYKSGAKVFLLARSFEKLNELTEELQALFPDNVHKPEAKKFDITNEEEGRKVIEDIGKIDILINNAGLSMRGSCAETSIQIHRQVMEVNFFGQVWTTEQALKNFSDDGCVIAISSVQGKIALPHRSSYSASKHALQAYFDSLRAEYKNFHVLVVSPGYINTGFGSRALNTEGKATGVEDDNQKKGMSPDACAKKIIQAIVTRETDVIIGDNSAKLAVFLRWFWPSFLNYSLYKRALKDNHGRSSNH